MIDATSGMINKISGRTDETELTFCEKKKQKRALSNETTTELNNQIIPSKNYENT